MDDCSKIRAKNDACPQCCRFCHDGGGLWRVLWKGEPRVLCCAVVAFALRNGGTVEPDAGASVLAV